MKNKWYILKNNNHFGPYSEKELEELFKNKQIDSKSILKKVGQSNQTFELSSFIKSKSKNENKEERKPLLENFESFFAQNKTLFQAIPFLLIPTFILGALFFSYKDSSKFEMVKPKSVSTSAYQNVLKNLSQQRAKGKADWEFLKDTQSKEIWLSTNIPGDSEVVIKFSSIPKKILGNVKTEFTVKATIKDYIAKLKNINFIHGDKVIPGHYQYFISLTSNSQNILHRLFGEDLEVKDFVKGSILLGSNSRSKMDERLAKFHGAKKTYKSHATQDIQMKYQTLASIAKNITSDLKKILPNMNKKKKKEFVELYQRKYGAFFTSFVIENEKQFRNLTKSSNTMNTEMVAHYSSLSRIAKNLGLISIEAMEALDKKSKSDVDQSFKKFNRMIELSNNKLKILSKTDSVKVQL